MPYDRIYGVMTQDNKIIIPAKYEKISLIEQDGKKQFLAFNPYAKDDKAIYRFDEQGRALPNGVNTGSHLNDDGASMPLRFHLERIDGVSDEDIKIKLASEDLMARFKKESQELENFESLALAESYIYHTIIEHSVLVDNQTGKRTPLAGKDIEEIRFELSPNEEKYARLPAKSHKTKKWGYIDAQGEWVIKPIYNKIDRGRFTSHLQVLHSMPKDNQILSVFPHDNQYDCYGFLDINGKDIGGRFSHIKEFDGQYAMAEPCDADKSNSDKKSNHFGIYGDYGIVNTQGEWVIKPQNNFSLLTLPDHQGYLVAKVKDKMGVMTVDGRWVIEPKYYFPHINTQHNNETAINGMLFDAQGLLAVMTSPDAKTYGFMNQSGQWHIKPTLTTHYQPYDGTNGWASNHNINSYRFDEHGFAYGLGDKHCQDCRMVFNTKGEPVLPHLRGYVGGFNAQGYAPFVPKGSNAMQVIDKQGTAVTELKFSNHISRLDEYNIFSLAKPDDFKERKHQYQRFGDDNDLVGVMNYKGDIIIPALYKMIDVYGEYIFVQTTDDLYGVLNDKNEWIIRPQSYQLYNIGSEHAFSTIDFGL